MSGFHLADMQQPLLDGGPDLSAASASVYLGLYRADPLARISVARAGLPAVEAKALLDDLGLSQDAGLRALNLSVATTNKKAKAGERLAPDESERVMGLARMMGQMEAMLGGGAQGFDTHAWLGRWLMEPLPALGHRRPAELLDTMEGQALVSQALARIESGAYA
ncbi:MAG TPA: antitoxin Xre/MbcA/ParS toxin-binding domain-containing protein [Acidisoma sp.]|uniref:type II RES/Xre toxin-antitoxin system antitoxin n=1 Tax=Acidisoma sp. TaxID=1872115 RepID=UPI002B7B0914|nr:antitoxin Xre/MbcA/ParS toxin-binding domain-containing protein [Acidisoma sp.]HTI01026.1 antitoxin Xre/MbcA/ParS toxin-binding domain-containing protein [Acidisoma sp.]